MTPSNSTLARWPTALSVPWETHRPQFEATWRHQAAIPPEAVAMAVSLDGVMAPMQDGQRHATRTHARAQGQSPSGPAGSQEVGGATVSSYDRHGERLCTRCMARMPEAKKATLKSQLTAAVMGALLQRPDVRGVTVADGAPDNWSYLGETLPFGVEVLDFITPQSLSALRWQRPMVKERPHTRTAWRRCVRCSAMRPTGWTKCWGRCVACARALPAVRLCIRRSRIFVRIATGGALRTSGRTTCRLALE